MRRAVLSARRLLHTSGTFGFVLPCDHMSILAAAPPTGSCYKNVWNTACLTCCEDASCRASGTVYIAQVHLVQLFLRYVWFRLALVAGMLAATAF